MPTKGQEYTGSTKLNIVIGGIDVDTCSECKWYHRVLYLVVLIRTRSQGDIFRQIKRIKQPNGIRG